MAKKAEKKLSINFGVVVPVYGIGILFSFGQTQEKLHAVAKKNGLGDSLHLLEDHGTPGYCVHNRSTTAVVVMREFPLRASDYGLLQHEIFHACDFTLRNIGFDLSNDSKEAWAYMVGHVTQRVYQVLWDKKYSARVAYWQKQLKKK